MEKMAIGGVIVWGVCVLALGIGWVMNLVKLIGFSGGSFAGNELEIIIRAVGLVAAPIGGVAGWF